MLKDTQIVQFKKLVMQIFGDIKDVAEALDLPDNLSFSLDKNNTNRYYINSGKVPIMTLNVTFAEEKLDFIIAPIGEIYRKYPLLFTYLSKRKPQLQTYVAVFFDVKNVKDTKVEIASKEM